MIDIKYCCLEQKFDLFQSCAAHPTNSIFVPYRAFTNHRTTSMIYEQNQSLKLKTVKNG